MVWLLLFRRRDATDVTLEQLNPFAHVLHQGVPTPLRGLDLPLAVITLFRFVAHGWSLPSATKAERSSSRFNRNQNSRKQKVSASRSASLKKPWTSVSTTSAPSVMIPFPSQTC